MREENHYIAGAIAAPANGQYIDARSPVTGAVIARVARGDETDVEYAVEAASIAQREWNKRRPVERGRILMAIAGMIRERKGELADLERQETGKSVALVNAEIEVAAQYFELYGGLVNALQGESIDLGGSYHSYTRREPFGVVGAILPWNAPLNQAGRAIAPALAAGNAVVAKPSEITSTTLLRVALGAVEDCGLPAGMLNVVTGLGPEAGAAVVRHPRVRKVAFTGSVRGGKEVARMAAERIIPLTLELGGKSPNIVFDDADLTLAIPGSLRAFTMNTGQICTAGSRILVHRSIHDVFVDGLKNAASQLRVGFDEDSHLGPVTTPDQYQKVQQYYRLAQEEGAVAVFGGALPEGASAEGGWYVSPTLYTGVDNGMRIAREEIFGPVACVIPFDTEEDAIHIANDTEYGLAAGIWTRDLARAHRVAASLEAGQIYVNEYMSGGVETPLGGYKLSGYGREKGLEALHHYTQLKCVTIKL